ncbi:MAG: hypothetical protein EOL97_09815 [Spirochaetia bacterium]|nr:hypothetical protein [Spirochaetia bacterium]
MKINNYKQLFAIQQRLGQVIKKACPDIDDKSGIYFYTRVSEEEKCAYLGKSINLLSRNVSHLQGYQQRIDISLKKRGFYSKENLGGWKLNVLHFPPQLLDEKERFYIEQYKSAGYELYNIESGGTIGKTLIGERKKSRGYKDGLEKGEFNTRKQVSNWFIKHLDYSIKGKETATKRKVFDRFTEFINIDKK